jgi:predicted nuclease of predicted toxin-antitoxin system
VKFLIDESISSQVAPLLVARGHEAVHLADLGLLGAVDAWVLEAARAGGSVLVSADTDFGELLALGRHQAPSLMLLRRAPHRPDEQAALVLEAAEIARPYLEEGAVVVVSSDRLRIRSLPIEADRDDAG